MALSAVALVALSLGGCAGDVPLPFIGSSEVGPKTPPLPYQSFAPRESPTNRPILTDADQAKLQADLEHLGTARAKVVQQSIEQSDDEGAPKP